MLFHSTWHNIHPATYKEGSLIQDISDKTFAITVNFLAKRRLGKEKLPIPTDSYEPKLYQVEKSEHSRHSSRYHCESFNPREHVSPDVLWLQPYDKRTSAISTNIALGTKIEFGELDAISFNLPNFKNNLMENNSHYYLHALSLQTFCTDSYEFLNSK